MDEFGRSTSCISRTHSCHEIASWTHAKLTSATHLAIASESPNDFRMAIQATNIDLNDQEAQLTHLNYCLLTANQATKQPTQTLHIYTIHSNNLIFEANIVSWFVCLFALQTSNKCNLNSKNLSHQTNDHSGLAIGPHSTRRRVSEVGLNQERGNTYKYSYSNGTFEWRPQATAKKKPLSSEHERPDLGGS